MDRKDLCEVWGVDENAIVLDPASYFDRGIVGVTEDKQHLIYSYQKITFEDFLSEACDFVDFNTIRSLPYMDSEYRPIIMIEFNGDKNEG